MSSLPIININALKSKDNLTNSDYILLLTELCMNSRRYKVNFPHTSKHFWKEIKSHHMLKRILKVFTAETLRKYWRIIRDVSLNNKCFISFITQHEHIINNPSMKLLPILQAISAYMTVYKDTLNNNDVPKEQFDTFIIAMKRKCDDVYTTNEMLLTKKRTNTINNNVDDDGNDVNNSSNSSSSSSNVSSSLTCYNDVVNMFINNFPKKTKTEILTALYSTSYNVPYTYLYLLSPHKYTKYSFTNFDDYIILNLKDHPQYTELIHSKGITLLNEREHFLKSFNNINHNNNNINN